MRLKGIIILLAFGFCGEVFGQNFSKISVSAFEPLSKANAEWVDFDNDGLLDLFVTGTNGAGTHKVVIYYNNGDDTFDALTLANWTNVGYDFGDYNQDGFIDIILLGNDAANTLHFSVLENTSGSSFSEKSLGLETLTRGGVAWVDIDADTDLDVVAIGLNSLNKPKLLIYEFVSGAYTQISSSRGLANGTIKSLDADNDELVEVIATGFDHAGDAQTIIYTLDREFGLTEYQTTLNPYALNKIALADINEDGAVDIGITGYSEPAAESSELLRNNSLFSFTEVSPFLDDLDNSSIEFGDLNNDGLPDILLMGTDEVNSKFFYYYKNSASYAFTSSAIAVETIYSGDAALGDYDNDGDLDLFQVGNSLLSLQSNLYASDFSGTVVNAAPSIPTSLAVSTQQDSITFSWNASTDDLTNASSLSYALYMSNEPAGTDLVISPLSNISTGYRKTTKVGNAGFNTTKTVYDIPEGTYYWSVQAIDNNGKASVFASEESFGVCYHYSIGNDTTICKYEDVSFEVTDPEATEVNWYLKSSGLQLSDSFTFTHTAITKDTVVAEITKSFGCTVYDTLVVDVYALPDFDLGNDTAVCYLESLPLSIASLGVDGLDYVNWYSPGEGLLLSNSESIDFEVLKKDSLIAEVFNVNGCVNYDTIIVDVLSLPEFILGNDTAICYAESLTLSVSDLGIPGLDSVNWYSTGLGSLLKDNESVTFEVFTKDTIIAEVFNSNGCWYFDSLIVDVFDLPDFNIGNDTAICYAESVAFTVSDLGIIGLDSVNWYSIKQGILVQDNVDLLFEVLEPDTIVAEVFNINGCVNYDSLIVSMFDPAAFDLGNDTTICYQEYFSLDIATLNIFGFDSVNWYSTGLGLIAEGSLQLDYEVLTKDTLVAEVYNVSGCVSYDSLIVDVFALPDFYIGNDTSICYAESLTLSVSDLGIIGLDSVNWYSLVRDSVLIADSEDVTYYTFEKDTLVAEVYNVNGCVNYDSIIVDMYPLPDFNIGRDTSICYLETISLRTGPSYAEVNWYSKSTGDTLLRDSWFFNYQVLVSDTIIAQVYNHNGCVNYDSIEIIMDPLPVYDLGPDPSICYGDSLELEVTGDWEEVNWFSTGNQILAANATSYKFRVEEDVVLWAEVWTDKGCVAYDTVSVTVLALPEFDLPSEAIYCAEDTINLQIDIPNASFIWTGKELGELSTLPIWTTIATSSDSVYVLAESDEGCYFRDSINIVVNPLPVYDILGESVLCIGDSSQISTSYDGFHAISWYVETDTLSTSHQFYIQPDQTAMLGSWLMDANNCVTRDSIEIIVNERPDVFAGRDTLICYESAIPLGQESLPNNTYRWLPEATLSDPTIANPIANPLEPTTYVLEQINEHGCNSIDSVYIEVNPDLTIDAGSDFAICLGDSIRIGGAPTAMGSQFDYHYNWSPAELIVNSAVANPIVFPEVTTWFYVEVTTYNCVVEYDSVLVEVNYQPEIEVSPQLSVGPDESITLEAYGGVEFQWSPENTVNDPKLQFPEVSPLETTLYTVQVTDENGCITYGTVNVLVQNVIFIPNLFTPNGDGQNDQFMVYGSGIRQITFSVYDLSGNLVYQTSDVRQANEIGWDGSYKGSPLPNGTYLWTISGEYYNGSRLQFNGESKGTIKLIR